MVIVLSCSKKHYTEVDFGIHNLYFFTCIKKSNPEKNGLIHMYTMHVTRFTWKWLLNLSKKCQVTTQKSRAKNDLLDCTVMKMAIFHHTETRPWVCFCKTVHDPFILHKYNLITKSDAWKRKTLIQFLLQIGNLGPTCTAAAASS